MKGSLTAKNSWMRLAGSVCLTAALFNSGLRAQEVPLGARPTAMGEAFVAVADDGNAAFWNPAGLSLLQGLEMNSMYADLYATGIKHSCLGLAFPFKNWGTCGLAWSRIGFDDFELTYGENQFLLSYGLKLPYDISFGLSTKLLRTEAEYEGVNFGQAHGWGLDLGLMCRSFEGLSIGLVLKDMGDTGVTYDSGSSATVLEQSLTVGAACRPTDRLLLAGSLGDRFHWGGEYWLSEALALRIGLQDDVDSNEPLSWSFGAGFRFKMVQFDYAYVDVPTLPSTHRFSFAVRFEQEEPWVQIERIQLRDLFAAQYKRYVSQPLGTVRVVNISDRTVTVKAGIEFNHYTDGPYYGEESLILGPDESKESPLFVILNQHIASLTADGTVQGTITLLCSTNDDGREGKVSAPQRATLFGRNAIRWDDVRNVAVFIAPKDEDVRTVTSRALKLTDTGIAFLPQNLLPAIAVFDLLGEHGLTYSPDPKTPYSSASRLHQVVDHVQYPAETLAEKRGDCDDFVVLYASCLENVGVPTAILDVPGHLLLAVEIGPEEDDGLQLGFEESSTFSRNGKIWVPVETTMFGKPFHQAWLEGISTVERWQDELHIVEVDEAWQVYPSNEIALSKPAVSIKATGEGLLAEDLEQLRSIKYNNILKDYERAFETNLFPCTTYDEIGVRLGQAGLFEEAIDFLQKACQHDSSSSQAFNNLGVAYSKQGLYDDAVRAFQKALDLNPTDAEVRLNLAFLYYELGDLDRARLEYEEAVKLNPDFEGQFEFLDKNSDLQKRDKEGRLKRENFLWQ